MKGLILAISMASNNPAPPITRAFAMKGAKAISPAASPKPPTTLNKPPRKPRQARCFIG